MMLPDTPLSRQFAACMGRLDPRMGAAVEWAVRLVSQSVSEGHVCLDLRRWAGAQVSAGAHLPAFSVWKGMLAASSLVGFPGEFKPLILDGERLYLARYWWYEKRLAENLSARAADVCQDVDLKRLRHDLDRLFAARAGEGPDLQKTAAAVAVLRRFSVISGGPGTGKTSTIVRILAALQLQADGQLRIALAAPTGKAAARMQESVRRQKHAMDCPPAILRSIPESASTLHRLLGAKPESVYFRHDREHPLMMDVVVVDEASMVDLALLAKLLDALLPSARLIILGDKDQLAAVEAGAVFGDICSGSVERCQTFDERLLAAAGEKSTDAADTASPPLGDCIVLLKHSHRFGNDSGIGQLAHQVNQRGDAGPVLEVLRDGRSDDIGWNPRFALEDLLMRMDLGYQSYFDVVDSAGTASDVLAAFNRFRVLAAHRDGPFGVVGVNRAFESLRRGRLSVPPHQRWYPGRPIIVTQNDYGLKLFNGDIGVCLKMEGELRVCFEDADGNVRSFPTARLPVHEPVYAMTVHKSQGSEFDEALLLLPEAVSAAVTRPLIYTAITRAKRRAEIWGGETVLAAGINKSRERSSGLRERLWGTPGSNRDTRQTSP